MGGEWLVVVVLHRMYSWTDWWCVRVEGVVVQLGGGGFGGRKEKRMLVQKRKGIFLGLCVCVCL